MSKGGKVIDEAKAVAPKKDVKKEVKKEVSTKKKVLKK